ncbi:DUF2807 domain-containing protein [Paraflavisolibacter sp. H34]|uniref:GIN domain-containing protein n=1 Tax=Huijunlia imazamoxiresistens TaxID=3127457 RepID=UPI0030195E81
MKSTRLLLLLLLSLSAIHCRKNDCFSHAGDRIKVQRQVESFHEIDLYDNINLLLTQDTVETLFVEAGRNLMPNITTTVEKGVLVVRNATSCKWLRDPGETINVHASVKALDKLLYKGTGNITSTNALRAPRLEISSDEGAGDIELSVNTDVVMVLIHSENAGITLHGASGACGGYINPRGHLDLSDLEVADMNLTYAGARNTTVNVSHSLFMRILHTGNVYYKGQPGKLTVETYSSGRLYPWP